MYLFAIISNGVVVNIAVWDKVSAWNPGSQYTLVEITNITPQPSIGYTYDGTNFTAPPNQDIIDPSTVTGDDTTTS